MEEMRSEWLQLGALCQQLLDRFALEQADWAWAQVLLFRSPPRGGTIGAGRKPDAQRSYRKSKDRPM